MPTHHQPPAHPAVAEAQGPERLQKILASAGLGSRRHCEELIAAGRVVVDRRVVTELGTRVDRHEQEIRVDGVPLAEPRLVYFMVNKPPGFVSTNRDPSGRPRVIDLVQYGSRLFTVGRLDKSSEGLILVTNDGELANRLTHPRYGVEKTYQVEVAGTLDRDELKRLRHGVRLAEGFARVVSAKVVRQYRHSTLLEIVLAEGRNREIRRLLARVGHKVERLKRTALGPLRLAELPPGHVRPLEHDEIRRLKRAARAGGHKRPGGRSAPAVAPKPAGPKPAGPKPAGPKPAGPKPAGLRRSIIGADNEPPRRFKAAPAKANGSKASAGKANVGKASAGGPRPRHSKTIVVKSRGASVGHGKGRRTKRG
jgi:23S rRNA pseudouridine2605 synthase